MYVYTTYSILNLLQCSGCSVVGYEKSSHYSYVKVEREHVSTKSLLHSLFHILGRYHEHQRVDREAFIHIYREEVIEGIVKQVQNIKINAYLYQV